MQRHIPQAHACFRLDIQFPLALPPRLDPFDVWHGLSYRIMREPADLLAHTRRVLLCRHPALRGNLAGALHDLFEATGSAGIALKQRLLRSCRNELSAAETADFQSRIEAIERVPERVPERAPERVVVSAFDRTTPADGTPKGSVLPTMAWLLSARTLDFVAPENVSVVQPSTRLRSPSTS